jgi:Ca2+-binding RTX toxin-like protein
LTTINLRGTYVDYSGETATGAGRTTLDVVLPSATTPLRYAIIGRDVDRLPIIDPRSPTLEVRLDGRNFADIEASQQVTFQMVGVNWSRGATTVLQILVDLGNGQARDYVFAMGGSALPDMRSLAQWNSFANSASGATPAGAFGPNRDIFWRNAPGAYVTEDDEFVGTSRRDVLKGGTGDDHFVSSRGNDRYEGGAGEDQVSFHRDPKGVVANLATATARDGYGHTDTMSGIENLRGSAFNDRLTGNFRDNAFRGLEGRDTITGGTGRDLVRHDRDANYGGSRGVTVDLAQEKAIDGFGDTDRLLGIEDVWGTAYRDRLSGNGGANELDGLAGHDRLFGRAARDTLLGGSGHDTLDGGTGNDLLIGGRGKDVFVFAGTFGKDRVLDFDAAGAMDRIDLSGVASITSFRDLTRNHLTEAGGSTIITAANGARVTLFGVARSELTADDFLF